MSWPTPQEYNEAIQNPRLCFADPELRHGVPEVTPLGLPRPITGNFASVYRVRCNSRDWAVRCFWRETADMQLRYEAISRHLASQRLPYTVGFAYLPRGIFVRGTWYPILKMEWVEGELLSAYVERHLHDASALAELTQAWLSMVAALERSSTAHGDLQHGNVLVVGDELKLVDYDCMYVPALSGRPSYELGHQNYQHPGRTERDFGPHLDRFSAWVVYLSLLALRTDPALWTAANGGDECLLLRRSDFERPNTSTLLASLTAHANSEVRAAAAQLIASLDASPGGVPPISRLAAGREASAVLQREPRLTRPFIDLWTLLVPSPGRVGHSLDSTAPPLPDWIRESEEFRKKSDLGPIATRAQSLWLCAAMSAMVAVLWLWLTLGHRLPSLPSVGISLPVAALLDFGVLLTCFRREASVKEMRSVLARERSHLGALRRLNRDRERLTNARARTRGRYQRRLASTNRKRDRLAQQERLRQAALEAVVQEGASVATWRIEVLDDLERQERIGALDYFQQEYVKAFLRRHNIWSAPIPQCSRAVKAALWLTGVRTALDVEPRHAAALKRWGEKRAAGVVSWRSRVQAEAKRHTPRTLPRALRDPIVERYTARRRAIQRRQEAVQAQKSAVAAALTEVYRFRCEAWGRRSADLAAAFEADCQEREQRIQEMDEQEAMLRARLDEVQRELAAYGSVTFTAYLRRVLLPMRPGEAA